MGGDEWVRGPAIGRGSTATVFLATSSTSGDLFAVKSAEFSRSALLQREQSILSALSSPSIISSFGFDVAPRDGGALFYNLFLEYAPGGSLADHIKYSGNGLDEPAIRYKTRDILTGLAYLHGQGVAHCDVKPGNVLLVSGERAKIGDLGCARWVAAGELEVRGTPMYMAPEAARGEEQGMSADVWSLGCTVIEMFTGRAPWPEIDDVVAAIHRIGFSGDVPEIPDWVSEEARDFLDKCLRNDPGERWTAEELLSHPFAASGCAEATWISPKSILDLSLWDSIEEEEEEEEGFRSEEPARRIRENMVVSDGPIWDWNDEWLEVRDSGGEWMEAEAAGAGDEGMVGGRWNADDTASTWGVNEESTSCKFCCLEKGKSGKIIRCGCYVKCKVSDFAMVIAIFWGFLIGAFLGFLLTLFFCSLVLLDSLMFFYWIVIVHHCTFTVHSYKIERFSRSELCA
ncbi:hypothetical protein IEQ34_018254 [Dendrobium chrysotoxum]|uniref:Protein kinase domain-containing protein n=1 Tax=Dendrobium chrysotoxum TaxID=161865 RepID=A0AAV7FW19_DENCH|nr:hypothetical protein IEQ34_018254 [Dendrobium chrysotoxum]